MLVCFTNIDLIINMAQVVNVHIEHHDTHDYVNVYPDDDTHDVVFKTTDGGRNVVFCKSKGIAQDVIGMIRGGALDGKGCVEINIGGVGEDV